MHVNREQALSVLCDLAFTIGGEVALEALLVKTLQRLLYHTGFPVGFVLTNEVKNSETSTVQCLLELAIGDMNLARRHGEYLNIPAAMLPDSAAQFEAPGDLTMLELHRPMSGILTLPIPGFGHMILLAPKMPAGGLPFAELFVPVLSRLSTSVTLTRSYERDVQRRIERGTHYDPLTDLPNTTHFTSAVNESLDRARRNGRMLALAYLDLDDFLKFNEKYGHEMADQVLIAFARALEAEIRPSEMAAHTMADEFTLLLPDLNGREDAVDRLAAILQEKRMTLHVEGQSFQVRASVGVSLFPVDAVEADTLMRHARMAMDDAKRQARGSFRFFDSEQDRLARERHSMMNRLSIALEREELVPYYQPKIDLLNGDVVGMEALLRWIDPQQGVRLPSQFLPAIESSDLICEIGRNTIARVIEQATRWKREGFHTVVSVNIAARHLLERDFIDQLRRIFADIPGAAFEDIQIEILETTAIQDFEHARLLLRECRQLGISIALDDFGTGYSSLAYLSQLPVTALKIDQLFVRRLLDRDAEPAIIRAIIEIARVFGYDVVAEGVETEAQIKELVAMGCRFAQGFKFGHPMPPEEVLGWFKQYSRSLLLDDSGNPANDS